MKKSIPDINLVNFTVARYYSEKNRYSRKVDSKYVLSLSDEEQFLLTELQSKNINSLSITERVIYQKLFIKQKLYEAINNGKSLLEVELPYPLLYDSIYPWIKAEGYAIRIIPTEYPYYYLDEFNHWQFNPEKIDPPDIACNYRILW